MTFWKKRKTTKPAEASVPLYPTEAADASADEQVSLEAADSQGAEEAAPASAEPRVSDATSSLEAKTRAHRKAARAAKKAARKREKVKANTEAKTEARERSADIEAWRKGVKGRPVNVFIGFLANASKKDAVKYAIGVASRNASSFENTGYAIHRWNGGWAYEVHEGGPQRAYLPAILRFFDSQGEHAPLDDLVVTIATAGRMVRVERTHTGLTGFLMPESFVGEQTEWLEPGPRLKPAASVRLGVLAAGGAVFGTGFLALIAAMMLRPDAPVVTAQKQDIPYDQLPISTWSSLLQASSRGYVNALQYANGKYTFSIAGAQQPTQAGAVDTPPPPIPAPQQGQ